MIAVFWVTVLFEFSGLSGFLDARGKNSIICTCYCKWPLVQCFGTCAFKGVKLTQKGQVQWWGAGQLRELFFTFFSPQHRLGGGIFLYFLIKMTTTSSKLFVHCAQFPLGDLDFLCQLSRHHTATHEHSSPTSQKMGSILEKASFFLCYLR